jgi:hypothetical protein
VSLKEADVSLIMLGSFSWNYTKLWRKMAVEKLQCSLETYLDDG